MSNAQGAHAIPGSTNIALGLAAVITIGLCLWTASHVQSWILVALAAIAFSFLNNTMYSLMHEAVHRHFHKSSTINETAGRLIAGFFPTAFSLQRAFHLAHHGNNRTERERFDYYAPGESRVVKYVQWYCILTGLYWFISPLFCLVYFFLADLIHWRHLFERNGRWFAKQTSAREFLDALQPVGIAQARIDILIAVLVQVALFWALDLSLFGLAVCYAAFAINWSSLQYTDHAFSTLDSREGAWNLRVHPWVRGVFLNYHHHLVHHRDPSIPWTMLPRYVRAGDPNPSFWSIYLQMWRGPRPLPHSPERS